jgi:nitrogen regulatory protein P-II 1
MKKVEAIIQPFEVEAVKEALTQIIIKRMTVTEVKGFGGPTGPVEVYRGIRSEAPYHIEAKVEIIVPDDMAGKAVAIFRETTETEEPESERIFVSSLEDINPLVTEKKRVAV